MRAVLLTIFAVLSGCGSVSSGAAVNAVINTSIAAGVSGARRARGDCYTPCDLGTECNRENGLCEPIPCEDQCTEHQRCVQTGLRWRCEPIVDVGDGSSPSRP